MEKETLVQEDMKDSIADSKQETVDILTKALGNDTFADLDAHYLCDLFFDFDEENNNSLRLKKQADFIKAMHEAIESSVLRRRI